MARFSPNQLFRIDTETFDQIDDWIKAAQQTGQNIQYGMEAMTMLLSYTALGFSQEMSRGPVDPQGRMKSAAWKTPVRRITSRYYQGWKVKRLAPNVWMTYNDSREAYFIQYGIHPTGSVRATEKGHLYTVRVRRPVSKLALTKTLQFVDRSRAGERVWEATFAPFDSNYRFKGRGSLISRGNVQSVLGMRNI